MSLTSLAAAVRAYYIPLSDVRLERSFSFEEQQAYEILEEAHFRIANQIEPSFRDLPLQEAIQTAHNMLGLPADTEPQVRAALHRNGLQRPLNNTIIVFFYRVRKYRASCVAQGLTFGIRKEHMWQTIAEAFRRIERDRNADVSDLHLLEAIHKTHQLLKLDPTELPHIDVTRRWEGLTVSDKLDERNYLMDRRAGLDPHEARKAFHLRSGSF